jgi:ribosome-binding ATPase
MPLSIGIVGLPNVGKSTLFNAITSAEAEAQNYPFCTIEPNKGIVNVPDKRLGVLSEISGTENIIPAVIEFVDIAGLVKGASKGEGLGNQFLANIRETSAIAHVVRCFDDDNVIHVSENETINPLEDIDIINTELLIADLDMAQKALTQFEKRSKSKNKDEMGRRDVFKKIVSHLEEGNPLRTLELTKEEHELKQSHFFLTEKKVIYVANVAEDEIEKGNSYVEKVKEFAKSQGDEVVITSAKIEEELAQLSEEEKLEFLDELGVSESGLDRLAKACFNLLGLETYLTTGVKETRAWTISKGSTAPQAAGVIHTDFEKGFIRANIVSYDEFVAAGGVKEAKEKGVLRQEGKDYIMKDGDVVEFLFNV